MGKFCFWACCPKHKFGHERNSSSTPSKSSCQVKQPKKTWSVSAPPLTPLKLKDVEGSLSAAGGEMHFPSAQDYPGLSYPAFHSGYASATLFIKQTLPAKIPMFPNALRGKLGKETEKRHFTSIAIIPFSFSFDLRLSYVPPARCSALRP